MRIIILAATIAALAVPAYSAPPVTSGTIQPLPRNVVLTPEMKDNARRLAQRGIGTYTLKVFDLKSAAFGQMAIQEKGDAVILQLDVTVGGATKPAVGTLKYEIAYQPGFGATTFATGTLKPDSPGKYSLDTATLAKLHSSSSPKSPTQNAIRAVVGTGYSSIVSVYVADTLKGGPYERK